MTLLALEVSRWETRFHRLATLKRFFLRIRNILVLRLRMPSKDTNSKTKRPQGVQNDPECKAWWSKLQNGALFPQRAILQEMRWAFTCDQ